MTTNSPYKLVQTCLSNSLKLHEVGTNKSVVRLVIPLPVLTLLIKTVFVNLIKHEACTIMYHLFDSGVSQVVAY